MVRLEGCPDAGSVARRAANLIAEAARAAISAGRRFRWAVSGGETPIPTFRRLSGIDLPWERIDTWQVDERVAPLGDPDRNRTGQEQTLPAESHEHTRWMPVDEEDVEGAAARYASGLPERFDLVQLGLGDDGHTASLVPGDPVLEVRDRDVAVTRPYQGRVRMTLTYPALSRAGASLWIVTGPSKREPLDRLLRGDRSIPATNVPVVEQVVVTDLDIDPDRTR
jgi:6-phosphogluconolactonase